MTITIDTEQPRGPGKYAFMAPGISGDTDDFNQALEWLMGERERFPESGAKGAIYIRLDLAVSTPPAELDAILEATRIKKEEEAKHAL